MIDAELRRVLVIAYYFPPMGLSGVQRTLKFVKYLPEYGWNPTVLTVEPRGYIAEDQTLLDELAEKNIRIVRTTPSGPGRFLSAKKNVVKLPSERIRKIGSRISDTLFIPDNKIGWKKKAVEMAVKLHEETPFDLIFATAPPFTDFLIGSEVKARINKPLVFDYRDPWVDYPFKFYPTPFHKLRNRSLEKNALRSSSFVVTTNRRVKELLIERYGFLTYNDIEILSQGFDPEDFEGLVWPQATSSLATKKMRITYAGIFWEDRIPDFFLNALRDLFVEKPELRDKIEAHFVGHFREENLKLVDKLGLKDSIVVHEYLPHKECIQHLVNSDVLWMIVGDGVGSPGKVYEYIGARKPILGCVPDGFLKTAILDAGGKAVLPNDVSGIKKSIEEFYDLFRRGELKGPDESTVGKYDRRKLTGSLVKIFESLIAN